MNITLRDRLAHRLANTALRLATPWYRAMIRGQIRYGLPQLPNHQTKRRRRG